MSNTESAATQWKEIAETLGFPDEVQMWDHLYKKEGRPIHELAKTLGFGPATVARRIQLCGIDKRSRGGANSPSRVLINVAHLDQRFVRLARTVEIAELVGSSIQRVNRVMKEL